jgi:hypothetical protein
MPWWLYYRCPADDRWFLQRRPLPRAKRWEKEEKAGCPDRNHDGRYELENCGHGRRRSSGSRLWQPRSSPPRWWPWRPKSYQVRASCCGYGGRIELGILTKETMTLAALGVNDRFEQLWSFFLVFSCLNPLTKKKKRGSERMEKVRERGHVGPMCYCFRWVKPAQYASFITTSLCGWAEATGWNFLHCSCPYKAYR